MKNCSPLKKLLLVTAALLLALSVGFPAFAQGLPPTPEDPSALPAESIDEDSSASAGPQEAPAPESAPEEPDTGSNATSDENPSGEAALPQEGPASPSASGTTPQAEAASPSIQVEAPPRFEDPTAARVASYPELKAALSEDNGITTVIFANDITASSGGISIHPGKAAVVIDGDGHTFTQYLSASETNTIRVAGASTVQVTLRNMSVTGSNPYGVVGVPATLSNITLIQENIRYTGPQPFYNRSGTVRILNSHYTLSPVTGIPTGELAEALHVEMGGSVTVTAENTSNGLVWLTGATSSLTFLQEASVTLHTNHYFLYTSGYTPGVTLAAGAALSLTSGRYGFTYADQRISSFTLATGSSLFIGLHTTESYAALRVSQRFQMDPDSSATIQRTGTAGIPLRLTNANAQAIFTQPRRVFFYSSAGVPLRFTGAGTLSITTSAINLWGKTSWPLSDDITTLPTHIWNKTGSTPLTLTASYNETVNRSLQHNLSPDDPAISPLDASSFNLEGSQLLAFGALGLTPHTPTTQSTSLNGSTNPGARLLASFTLADGQSSAVDGSAGSDGDYSLPLSGGALQAGSTVSVVAKAGGLAIRQNTSVQDGTPAELSFLSVPQQLSFGTLSLPQGPTLLHREGDPFALTVADTRPTGSPWRVDASISSPLTASVQGAPSQLPSAVVYQPADGPPQPLSESPLTVHSEKNAAPGTYDIRWAEDEGILLQLSPGNIYSGVNYTTTLHWSLIDAP